MPCLGLRLARSKVAQRGIVDSLKGKMKLKGQEGKAQQQPKSQLLYPLKGWYDNKFAMHLQAACTVKSRNLIG
jgi:hypothetical protein